MCKFLCEHIFLGKMTVEMLGYMVTLYIMFWGAAKEFSKINTPFNSQQQCAGLFLFFFFFPTLFIILLTIDILEVVKLYLTSFSFSQRRMVLSIILCTVTYFLWKNIYVFFFLFWGGGHAMHGMQNLNPQTRNPTYGPCSESPDS